MTTSSRPATLATDLAYYAAPGIFTMPGAHVDAVNALPRDVASLAAIVQGLLVHRFWMPAYRLPEPSKERDLEQGLHGAEAMLSRALALDARPIAEARPPEHRVIGICRHFAVLMTALLRHHGVPARARCGFATYFERRNVDHWVCEYWREDEARWVMLDVQLDPLQRAIVKPDFDPLDVPRDRFIVAGQAWRDVRDGGGDGATYGIADMWGAWYIRGNLLLDAASLAKMELLPWEPWIKGENDQAPNPAMDALCDELAALSHDPAASMAPLRARLDRDDARIPQALIDAALRADIDGPTTGNAITEG